MRITADMEEAALRSAVGSGDFMGAETASRLYVAALEAELPQLSPAQAERCLREGCGLIEWTRRCLCVARVRLSDELRRTQRVAAYRRAAYPNAEHTWRIDG
jgi:hypothetical protein